MTLKNDNFFLAKKKKKLQLKQNFYHGKYYILNRKELLTFFLKQKKKLITYFAKVAKKKTVIYAIVLHL